MLFKEMSPFVANGNCVDECRVHRLPCCLGGLWQ